ncbi:hypothetical protein [Brachybacterium sp. Z12]|uniref:hypothetical protein n=1 Tax=Brachybacterium sp. Z12 TaxID=2759167 RepID=UPI00223BC53A|nr:hypothetical protein [Brachybacterium sp. Z12]
MESINLGAVLFGILLLLWLAYALPRTASRRDVMGRARAADDAEMTPRRGTSPRPSTPAALPPR